MVFSTMTSPFKRNHGARQPHGEREAEPPRNLTVLTTGHGI
jgi:hypothetical protein